MRNMAFGSLTRASDPRAISALISSAVLGP